MNAAAERLTGWTLDAVRGRHIEDVFCVETEDLERAAEDFIEKVLTSKQGFAESQSVRLAAKSGKIWHVAASAAPITLDGGGIIGVIFTFKDMTERMLDIERAQALERMHTVERLAAGVAKDFNEAVSEIAVHSQKVLEKLVVGELPAWEDAAAVVKTNERAQRLVRHLLVIGQGQHAKASIIEVADFIGTTADLLSRTLGPDIFVKGRHQVYVWPIRADAGMLQEALAELAHYGRDVMRTGGTLVLEAANEYVEESRGPQRGPTAPGAYVKIVLRDASGGVEESDVLRVLEPYFKPRLRQQEATIKLAVAHGLVRQNRGFLAVTSETALRLRVRDVFPARRTRRADGLGRRRGEGEPLSVLMFRMLATLELGEEQRPVVAHLLPHADLGRVVADDGHRLDGLEELVDWLESRASSASPSAVPACASTNGFPNSLLARSSSAVRPARNFVRSAAGPSASTPSMNRLTLAAFAPGVSVWGMISSLSVMTVEF